ncbi:hypothetical protein CYMTET_46726 [Cymbomonas tetramitiformis]|uniref:Uncharacterized protein n=1 Tax=Cymbomonas tetramitiformis TaxID=36881 RepID=A0AAE0BXI5_9CHLO|nr:hypothetical protein CYMTET_46726 [Cymbomonas tetramitiformis]
MLRIVRDGGTVLITVWAVEQENPRKTLDRWVPLGSGASPAGAEDEKDARWLGGDYFVPWQIPFHRAEAAALALRTTDRDDTGQAGKNAPIYVDNKKAVVVCQRYYHLFGKGEMEELLAEVIGAKIVRVYFERSNWCAVLCKVQTQ